MATGGERYIPGPTAPERHLTQSAEPAESPSTPATPPHHRSGGGFQNPWPGFEEHGFGDFIRWRFGGGANRQRAPSPPRNSLARREPAIVRPRAARGYRSVTWVGHSTALLQLGPLNVLTDPIWSDRASPIRWAGPRRVMSPGVAFESLPDIDVVLQSHDHYDHLDAQTVRRIAERWPAARWLCPLGVSAVLRSFGAREVIERDWWASVDIDGFCATCTPAQHFSGRGLGDRGDRLWCGWTLAADDTTVFFAGDTALHPDMAQIASRLGPFDLVLLPIGAYDPRWFMRGVHMDPDDAVAAYRALSRGSDAPPACLPIHWGTFRLTDEPVEEPPALFARAWADAGLPQNANWTVAHGETRQLRVAERSPRRAATDPPARVPGTDSAR
ncbi:MAG: MBL fold metallo-hydrolase [Gemmatimonadales bacterium]